MAGRGYTIFDTAIGQCGIAWGQAGVVGVQLPEAREIETRRRLFKLYPDAHEMRPTADVEHAIEGIAALLHGDAADLNNVPLDMTGFHVFFQRIYGFLRTIPRGETRTCGEIAAKLRLTGAVVHSIAQAVAQNPFVIIAPCHRVLDAGYADKMSPHGGVISKRRLLSIEGAKVGTTTSKTLFDVLLPVAPPRPHS